MSTIKIKCTRCKNDRNTCEFTKRMKAGYDPYICYTCKRNIYGMQIDHSNPKTEPVMAKCMSCEKQYKNTKNNHKFGRCENCKKGTSFDGTFLGSDTAMGGF